MGTQPRVVAVGVGADQIRRHRQPLQILQSERPLPISGRQLRERIPPHLSPEELPAAIQRIGHEHSLPQRTCCVADVRDPQATSLAVDVTRASRIHSQLPADGPPIRPSRFASGPGTRRRQATTVPRGTTGDSCTHNDMPVLARLRLLVGGRSV